MFTQLYLFILRLKGHWDNYQEKRSRERKQEAKCRQLNIAALKTVDDLRLPVRHDMRRYIKAANVSPYDSTGKTVKVIYDFPRHIEVNGYYLLEGRDWKFSHAGLIMNNASIPFETIESALLRAKY